jgi:hypothetical protein
MVKALEKALIGPTRFTDPADDMPRPTVPQDPMLKLTEVALATVTGPRQSEYGDKLDNFTQLGMAFTAILARKLRPGSEVTANDVALLMMQMKIVRLSYKPDHKDSLIDVVGYALCKAKIDSDLDYSNGPGNPAESKLDMVVQNSRDTPL